MSSRARFAYPPNSEGRAAKSSDQAAAYSHYLCQRDDAADASIDAAELKLRAERRLGELLTDTVVPRGNHRKGHGASPSLPPEISKKLSHQCQQAAKVPEEKFEALVEQAREKGDVGKLKALPAGASN
jgi:hypothetical protein